MTQPIRFRELRFLTCGAIMAILTASVIADDEQPVAAETEQAVATEPDANRDAGDETEQELAPPSPFGEPEGAIRLLPQYNAWIDGKRKIVIMDGKVCLREGQLEMFICTKGTKEHESIISVDTKAYAIHAALQAVGGVPGRGVQFAPKYIPATGSEIEIHLLWKDAAGTKHSARGQDWILDASTKKEMQFPWVFAGSGFIVDETDGTRYYQAESGDFICVSNFPSAMLDLPVKSTDANQGLLFEAYTERIPPLGTPVRVVLRAKAEAASSPPAEKAPPNKNNAE